MWSLEYVQVPIERKLKRFAEVKSHDNTLNSIDKEETAMTSESSKKMEIFNQIQSISSHDENGNYNSKILSKP